jgi:hypothetical protein
MDKKSPSASPLSSVLFLVLAVALAAAIHLVLNEDYERDLARQLERRRELEDEVDIQEGANRALEIEKDALQRDPQTVERLLRKNGYGRPGDLRLDVERPAATGGR